MIFCKQDDFYEFNFNFIKNFYLYLSISIDKPLCIRLLNLQSICFYIWKVMIK